MIRFHHLTTTSANPLYRFNPNPDQALTQEGSDGGSLFYGGRFYDLVKTHRRGQTSLSFKKPKLTFKLPRKVDA